MSKYGTALQAYNNDLVKGIEELRIKRNKLNEEAAVCKRENDELSAQIATLKAQQNIVQSRLDEKLALIQEYDERIATTEQAFVKILESSQTLLEVLKRYTKEGDNPTAKETTTTTTTTTTTISVEEDIK